MGFGITFSLLFGGIPALEMAKEENPVTDTEEQEDRSNQDIFLSMAVSPKEISLLETMEQTTLLSEDEPIHQMEKTVTVTDQGEDTVVKDALSSKESPATESATQEMLSALTPLVFESTAYCPCEKCNGIYSKGDYTMTASGTIAKVGTVAVDPKVIPLGTKLYVDGYGFATAEDTGGAIKGNKIDLFFETHEKSLQHGRKTVNVYIIE